VNWTLDSITNLIFGLEFESPGVRNHDKLFSPSVFAYCKPLKNWRRRRPGNKATTQLLGYGCSVERKLEERKG